MTNPWSANSLKKLGRCIRDSAPVPSSLPDYLDVMLWYNDLAASVQQAIAAHDWSPILGSVAPEVTSRPKTIDTLRDKLRRDPNTPLPSIQDVAGVRFEAEMTLDQQDAVVRTIVEMYDHDPSNAVHDLRMSPHSGYRAVHVWLRLAGRVEVQVRTHLQGKWANMYESAADFLGREIRYDGMPTNATFAGVVESLRSISVEQIAELEASRNAIEKLVASVAAVEASLETGKGGRQRSAIKKLISSESLRLAETRVFSLMQEKEVRDRLSELHDAFDSARVQQ